MNQEINQTTPPRQPRSEFSTNEVLQRFLAFFKAPDFGDDLEKSRKALILNSILLALFLVMAIYLVVIIFTNENPIRNGLIVFTIQLLVIGNYIAVRRGSVQTASIVFVLFMWILIMTASVLYGQAAYNPLIPFLFLVLSVAGTMLDNRYSISMGILSLVFVATFYLIDQNTDLPQILELTEVVFISRMVMGLIFATFLTAVYYTADKRSMQQVQSADEKLRKTNLELEEIRSYLEDEVARNTLQLERRSQYLEASAKVANVSITTQNLQEMLDRVADEISKQFGFYHVGIFLLDEQKQWAALRATSSEGGRQMIARNHRLAVGAQGIVGYVTSLGQARISQDTGDDRVHEPAAELSGTRSEMALPLISRNEVIGALDIQDIKPEAFTQDDINVLQTMADQIALAIENIRLYAQTEESLEEAQRLFGDYSKQAWHEIYTKNLLTSYRYFGGAVSEAKSGLVMDATENTVSIPVEVRGVKLGAIEISKGEEGSTWSDEEMKLLTALAEQLGIALDSARLFTESQLRATTEHTISAINSQLWETMEINSILKTTAQNLRETLALPELTIRMATIEEDAEESPNGNLELDEIQVND